MKLVELLHNFVDGVGHSPISPDASRSSKTQQPPKRPRPARINDFSRRQVLSNVTKVMVQARETGPRADLCWLLADAEDKILLVMQSGKTIDEGFFDWICNSPGFDRTAIRRAMRSTRKARYTVWQHGVVSEKAPKTR